MKYAGLSYSTYNIGDDIQTVAATRLLPRVDLLIDRDRLDEYASSERTVIVMNGWFTPRPQAWPPAPGIAPVFVGFHLSDRAAPLLHAHRSYFSANGPVGCRDRGTLARFSSWQVPAFLSYCLTLTLPRRERPPATGKVVVVDAANVKIPRSLRHRAMAFSHMIPPATAQARFTYARELLDFYRHEVSLAITTRLHCVLPCMAMGIPVVFFGDRTDNRLSLIEELGVRIHSRRLHRRSWRGMPGRLTDRVDWSPQPVDLGAVPRELEAAVARRLEAIS
jgi:hypothetical protein